MKKTIKLTKQVFLECASEYKLVWNKQCNYSSLAAVLSENSRRALEQEKKEHSAVLKLLGETSSMILRSDSINTPFGPFISCGQTGRQSRGLDNFTEDELFFFEEIVGNIEHPLLKARVADLLWLLGKQRRVEYAITAVDSYRTIPIASNTFRSTALKCWERAARLCLQINSKKHLDSIKNQLFDAFCVDNPKINSLQYEIAFLLDKLRIDAPYLEQIAAVLSSKAVELESKGFHEFARKHFSLATKKYKQLNREDEWLKSLIAIAESFCHEGDKRSCSSNMVAGVFYENALQSYRNIPAQYRAKYDIDTKIELIKEKISVSRVDALDEMTHLKGHSIDVSDLTDQVIKHISGKSSLSEALSVFTAIYRGPKFENLKSIAKKILREGLISSLMPTFKMSSDGRVIAKTQRINPALSLDDPGNQPRVHETMKEQFAREVELVVVAMIFPSLVQILKEHRVTKDFLVEVCIHSPIVPSGRERLLGYALWLGFEKDFGAAIHLLCPQVEHIVRSLLKGNGTQTTITDKNGITTEMSLSSLMENKEIVGLLGEDVAFELRSVFTDPSVFNLRNKVAHGLLDDDSSYTEWTIYAWWMVLRMVFDSIYWKYAELDQQT